MKRIIREYLASVRERGELDAMLPDLLSEMGFTVFSWPSRGPRQFGVDVAAIGPQGDGRVYLFSIKRGDLTRSEWNGGSDQALRPSLDEIFDAYIPHHLPPEYADRPIVICPCFGGEVTEAAHEAFNGYMKTRRTDRIDFEVWNGDRIAGLLEEGLLREGLLSRDMRSSLRKAIAISDEPDASFSHFRQLVDSLTEAARSGTPAKKLTAARQISISLWMLFVWAREQGNLESSYLATEYSLLIVWNMAKDTLGNGSAASQNMGRIISELLDLHYQVWGEFFEKKVLPHAPNLHGLSAAVRTASPLDVNLKLFNLLGRIALRGLWLVWENRRAEYLPGPVIHRGWNPEIDKLANDICGLITANPVLFTPIADEQVIDITLCLMFLAAHGGRWTDLETWLAEMIKRLNFSYRSKTRYPSAKRSYEDLANHPRNEDPGYFEDATQASVLLPTLAIWSAAVEDDTSLSIIDSLKKEILDHCTMQLWLPDEASEAGLWQCADSHGAAFFGIPTGPDDDAVLSYVLRECGKDTPLFRLSAVVEGFWPLVLVACRHHRLPIPPHFLFSLMPHRRHKTQQSPAPENPKYASIPRGREKLFYLTTTAIFFDQQTSIDWSQLGLDADATAF